MIDSKRSRNDVLFNNYSSASNADEMSNDRSYVANFRNNNFCFSLAFDNRPAPKRSRTTAVPKEKFNEEKLRILFVCSLLF